MHTIKELKKMYDDHLSAFDLKQEDGLLTTALNAAEKEGDYLAQPFIDAWGKQRPTESDNSYNARIGHLRRFLSFCNERGCTFRLPELLPFTPTKLPYIPTEAELDNLFRAADELGDIPIKNQAKVTQLRHMLNAIQAPVVLRTLFSTGIRTVEARLLLRENVNLDHGRMSVSGKGYKERTIPIHPSLLTVLREYDLLMEKLIPNRKYFFCREKGLVRSKHWPSELFKPLWDRYNDPEKGAVAYCLRHLYAIRNINRWDGQNIDDHLAVLSHSMGHDNVETTVKYYYQWLPDKGAKFNENNRNYFEMIAPQQRD